MEKGVAGPVQASDVGVVECKAFSKSVGDCEKDEAGAYTGAWKGSREKCQSSCEATEECRGFSYSERRGACYLHSWHREVVKLEKKNDFQHWSLKEHCIKVCEECQCEHAQLLDLRYVVYSNLGCQGPNVTFNGHPLPCDIVYYNVLSSDDQNDITYMHVRDTSSEYQAADTMMNGVTRESMEDCEKRGVTNCEDKRGWGAYGQVNVKAGTYADLEIYFTKNAQVTYLDKIFQLQILDIDQGRGAMSKDFSEIGGETLSICTGPNSWGYPEHGGKAVTQLEHQEVLVAGQVCHTVESTAAGSPADNVWNPAVKENGEYVGLPLVDREKAFSVATYKRNITFTYEVKEGGVNEGFAGRNLVFAGHASSFCTKANADKVKADSEAMQR
jgi:hypothetical protein